MEPGGRIPSPQRLPGSAFACPPTPPAEVRSPGRGRGRRGARAAGQLAPALATSAAKSSTGLSMPSPTSSRT
jgi:hypothetical protein